MKTVTKKTPTAWQKKKKKLGGLPDGSVVKNLPANARGMGVIPDPRRPHWARGNQVCVPQLPSSVLRAQGPQPVKPSCPRAHALQREATATGSPYAAMKTQHSKNR